MGRSERGFPRQRPLTPVQQAYYLKLLFPNFNVTTARNQLRCIGTLQPSPMSDVYTVQVEYEVPDRPRVHVLQPELQLAKGKTKLPHVFPGNELCLHLSTDWRSDQKICEFIMPWISVWLYFYEVWLVTGEWLGGGHEPSVGAK
jgi:hypothetical protein